MRGARCEKEFIPCLVLLYDGKYNFEFLLQLSDLSSGLVLDHGEFCK